jgi:hypothetical protein
MVGVAMIGDRRSAIGHNNWHASDRNTCCGIGTHAEEEWNVYRLSSVRAHASAHPHLIGFAAEAAKVGCQGVAELLSAAGVNKCGNERNPERVGVPSWANQAWPHWKKNKRRQVAKNKKCRRRKERQRKRRQKWQRNEGSRICDGSRGSGKQSGRLKWRRSV